jgi:hypothetical protein
MGSIMDMEICNMIPVNKELDYEVMEREGERKRKILVNMKVQNQLDVEVNKARYVSQI